MQYLKRLSLNLAIVGMEIIVVVSLIGLFNHWWPPVKSVVMVVGGAGGVWFLLEWRKKQGLFRKPILSSTTWVVVAIIILSAFAGVQPMEGYKDEAFSIVRNEVEQVRVKQEEARIEQEEEREALENEMLSLGIQEEYEFYLKYTVLFNEFRDTNDERGLTFDKNLNELAAQRAMEISVPGNFNHDGIMMYDLGENIAMLAYSSDSPVELLRLWASSPRHRGNMLDSGYRRTGFAKHGKYAVQVFD